MNEFASEDEADMKEEDKEKKQKERKDKKKLLGKRKTREDDD